MRAAVLFTEHLDQTQEPESEPGHNPEPKQEPGQSTDPGRTIATRTRRPSA